jgi:PPK2 family polyphosphate:nucleotide phosphotransferase
VAESKRDQRAAAADTIGGSLRETLRAPHDPIGVTLEGFDPAATPCAPSEAEATAELVDELRPRLEHLHELLMAHEKHAVLVLLQGLDASGKSGTIKHVISAMNPVGVRVTSFKEPEGEEENEPFLERIKRALPDAGQLGVFDRSQYEDAIVPAVYEQDPPEKIDERVAAICEFENQLVADGTVIVKFLLNISYDEQRERFLRRLRRHDKRWKFSDADVETRRRWPAFHAAYGDVVGRTSTDIVPWYVIPADNKWYRNWAVAQILVDVLGELHDDFPRPDLDLDDLREQLAPPN